MAVKIFDGEVAVRVTVNGIKRIALAEPRMLLSDFLRQEVELTGTHVGCEQGVCGACTVRIDGELVRSCITFAVQVEGAAIETVEGMNEGAQLHPIQQAFQAEHGLQCGFCTPAMLLTTQALLEQDPDPSEETIREFISGNVCRCTGYESIVKSVGTAARQCGRATAACLKNDGPAA